MTRHIEPVISDRDPLLIYQAPFALNSKVDLARSMSSFLPEQQIPSTREKREHFVNWEDTLEKCIKSIVSIKSCRPRGLDTEIPGSFTATGFVVDPERGIILSNRHVVSVSPIIAYAILCNYEEVELKPIYRDPVHDFGFFQYDTSKVKFLNIPGIELYPKGAKIGQDIRVVGNDAGEKLSILSGTLARLDREAPSYGIGEYNDFNTFYYQAASSTSSGSSGSPVLDIHGRAIALNAGGAQSSSSSYYLPLDRVQKALALLQSNQSIPRGTLQTTFDYMSYDSLIQLGLSHHIEKRLRARSKQLDSVNEGLLVVKSVLPNGPASGSLEPGDILLTCNGNLLPRLFIDLEENLDSTLGSKAPVCMVVSRAGELKEFSLQVQDLHSITPYRYLEFGGGILNDISYQVARSYGLSLKDAGVYVGAAGFMLGTALALRRSVIVGINNQPVKSLDDFVSIVSEIEQGKRIPIRYYSLSRPMKTKVMVLQTDWRWHKFRMAVRNDQSGIWDYTSISTPLTKILSSVKAPVYAIKDKKFNSSSLQDLKKSIVSVDCYPPFVIDGLKNSHSYGAGIIVSMDPPLILCDRDTVPVGISVISLTFENSLTISADLLFLHPLYNYAILKFDPSAVFEAGIEIKVASLDDSGDFNVGDSINYVGLSGRSEVDVKRTTITTLAPIRTSETAPPRWRATNVEAFKVSDGNLASQGGIFADDEGKVKAIWMSFSIENDRRDQTSILGGLPARLVAPIVNKIKANESLVVKGLDVEFWTLQISNARLLGVSNAWIEKLKEKSQLPSVLYILGITDVSSLSGRLLKPGDIVLSINDKILTNISDLVNFSEHDQLAMTIIRDGQEQILSVPTTQFDGKETTEVIGWQGMLIQNTYTAAKEQAQKIIPEGVYVSCCLFGSPAQANLKPGIWITEIDQIPVKTLDMLLEAVKPERINERQRKKLNSQKLNESVLKNQENDAMDLLALPTKKEIEEMTVGYDESHIRIKFVTADNVTQVRALKIDEHYWPTWHIKKDESSVLGWKMTFSS
ncbi:hypothetical protein MFLAVUS_003214 [Mucor flavus]|uniref:PDZ domain-containing protein n=1 Tax=Mucor flavus TaxID=439312 RepID=A0ABP9YSF8_9FUNG